MIRRLFRAYCCWRRSLPRLAAVGFVVVRVALRQTDYAMALAQGLVVGPALWGLIVNFVLHVVPGLAGAMVGWGVTVALGVVLARRSPRPYGRGRAWSPVSFWRLWRSVGRRSPAGN